MDLLVVERSDMWSAIQTVGAMIEKSLVLQNLGYIGVAKLVTRDVV